MRKLRGLDLFAGIGGASIAMQRTGVEVAAHAEIEPFCCRVLEHRFPGIPNYGDVAKINPAELVENYGLIDLVSFGSPCQDWSVAGKRLGLKGHRSSLFHEAIRIIRLCKPRFALFENVPGLFSSAGGWDFASVLDEMAESGALDIAWRVLDAQWFGVPQRRRRIFLIADFRGERAGEILSISEGVFRHPAPSREAGEEVAIPALHGIDGKGGNYGYLEEGGAVAAALRGRDEGARVELSGERTSSIRGEGGSGRDYVALAEVAPAIRSNYSSDHDGDESRLIPEVAGRQPTRYGKGANSSVDDGALIPFNWREDDTSEKGSSPPITHDDVAVAFAENQRAEIRTSEVHPQSTAGRGKAGQGYPAVATFGLVNHATPKYADNLMPTMNAEERGGGRREVVSQGMAVRRLTPKECERLQGFPDGWTNIEGASDSARYRALGNSWAVPVGEWIMRRVAEVADDSL